jgi:hypothetical protein
MRSSKPTQASPPDSKAAATNEQLPTDTQQKRERKKLVLVKDRVHSLSPAVAPQLEYETPKPRSQTGDCKD